MYMIVISLICTRWTVYHCYCIDMYKMDLMIIRIVWIHYKRGFLSKGPGWHLSYVQVTYSWKAQCWINVVLLALLNITNMAWQAFTTALYSGDDRIRLPTYIYASIVGFACLVQWGIAMTDRFSTGIKQLLSIPTMAACLLLPVMVAGQNTGISTTTSVDELTYMDIKHWILFWRFRRLIRCYGALNQSMLHQCYMASQLVSMSRSSVISYGQLYVKRIKIPATTQQECLVIIYWCLCWWQWSWAILSHLGLPHFQDKTSLQCKRTMNMCYFLPFSSLLSSISHWWSTHLDTCCSWLTWWSMVNMIISRVCCMETMIATWWSFMTLTCVYRWMATIDESSSIGFFSKWTLELPLASSIS